MLTSHKEREPVTEPTMRALLVSLGLAMGLGASVSGQTVEKKPIEIAVRKDNLRARAVFEEVAKAYKGLNTYSDNGEFVIAFKIGDTIQKQVLPMKMTFARPNKLDLDSGLVRILSDGATLTTAVIPLKRYTTAPAPKAIGVDVFREGPIGAMIFGGPAGPPMFVLLSLLTGDDPAAAVAQLGGTLQLPPARTANLKGGDANSADAAFVIEFDNGKTQFVVKLDQATRLISSIEIAADLAKDARGMPKAPESVVEQYGWRSGAITTSLPKEHRFAYVAPKDFTRVDSLGEPDAPAGHPLLGRPAPAFTLTVLDGPDRTKTITKAELAGKVVVIDFWATWCKPCMEELPEIQKVVEAYAASKKDVVIVALSQDSEPAELLQVRRLVEKTIAERKFTLARPPVGWIGVDPSKSVGGAFELNGYPTLVILDRRGVVQSVRVGYDSQAGVRLNEALAKDIDNLLAGKSLVKGAETDKEEAKRSEK